MPEPTEPESPEPAPELSDAEQAQLAAALAQSFTLRAIEEIQRAHTTAPRSELASALGCLRNASHWIASTTEQ